MKSERSPERHVAEIICALWNQVSGDSFDLFWQMQQVYDRYHDPDNDVPTHEIQQSIDNEDGKWIRHEGYFADHNGDKTTLYLRKKQ